MSASFPARSALLYGHDALCLDSAYSGHLLIDTTSCDVKPTVFDATTVTETTPWWNHLIPTANASSDAEQHLITPPTSLMTAEDMFATFVDPYAQFRQRLVYPSKQDSDMVTPPGQLYQRFNYEDALSMLPTEMPTFPTLEPESMAIKDEDCDTPPELIEAAVAALMTTQHQRAHEASPIEWDTPVSATFESDFHRPQGVVRNRSHTMVSQPMGWFTPVHHHLSHVTSPDPFQIGQNCGGDGELHECQWLGCHQILPNAPALTNHVNKQHIARRQPAHRCLWQGCNRADHVFRHRDKILIHIRLHTNDRPYECDFPGCDKQFSRADSLDAHKKVHSAEGKAWHCRQSGCGRTYFHAKSLKKHERTAHGLDSDV